MWRFRTFFHIKFAKKIRKAGQSEMRRCDRVYFEKVIVGQMVKNFMRFVGKNRVFMIMYSRDWPWNVPWAI